MLCSYETFTVGMETGTPTMSSEIIPGLPISSEIITAQPVFNPQTQQNQVCTQILQNDKMIDPVVKTAQLSDLANNELIGVDKPMLVRFKYTNPLDGKIYYLSIMPYNKCQQFNGLNSVNSNTPLDCTSNILVLIDEDTVNKATEEYIKTMNINQKVCNFRKTITDIENGKRASSHLMGQEMLPGYPVSTLENLAPSGEIPTYSEELRIPKDKCYNDYTACNLFRQYSTDFIITKRNTDGQTKYTISGVTGGLNSNKNTTQVFLNITPSSGTLCADMTNPTTKYTQVDLITTKIQNNGNIIGGLEANLKSKIRFKVAEIGKNSIITETTGYIGNCVNSSCTIGDKNYPRLCLFSDLLDPNVIDFEPIIKQY